MSGVVAPASSALLSVPRRPLIGRTREVAAACELLCRADVALLTLIGPGGVGKTRLALAIAAEFPHDFSDGVSFVALASVTDPALVIGSIAHALGISEIGGQPIADRLRHALRERRLLLVLDNFEHVADAAGDVAGLLSSCPFLTVLATSRTPLHVQDEHVLPVQPLATPDAAHLPPLQELAQNDSVALFAERARAVQPAFALTEANAVAVANICDRLDGLPLAIELAAARVRMLPPAALLVRLERRLPLLTGGPRDVLPRQQTLRDTIAWSYDLLDGEHQRLFRQLAVFVGGCPLDAAQVVGLSEDEALDRLQALFDHSLLQQAEQPIDVPRYTMLETIREYAWEQLEVAGELREARQRLRAWAHDLAEEAHVHVATPAEVDLLRRLEVEYDNLRSVLLECIEEAPHDDALAIGLHIARGLWWMWTFQRRFSEASTWLERLLAFRNRIAPGPLAWGLCEAGYFAIPRLDLRAARILLDDALAVARASGDQRCVIAVLTYLGETATWQGDYDRAAALTAEALALSRRLSYPFGVIYALYVIGVRAALQGHHDLAHAAWEEGVALCRASGDAVSSINMLKGLSLIAAHAGDTGRALALQDEATKHNARFAVAPQLPYMQTTLAFLAITFGDVDSARELMLTDIAIATQTGSPYLSPQLVALASIAAAHSNAVVAARLIGAADALRSQLAVLPAALETRMRTDAEQIVLAALGPEGFRAEQQVGAATSLDELLAQEATVVDASAASMETSASTTASSLTPREQDVLRLIVEGHPDREIAEALFISPRTVTSHVTNILNKLGVNSRSAAAAYAVRHDLA